MREVTPDRFYPGRYSPGRFPLEVDCRFQSVSGVTYGPAPLCLPAGAVGTWLLRMQNRGPDLPAGAALGFARINFQPAFRFQTERPTARDYATIETESGAALALITGRDHVSLLQILITAGVWRTGETATVRLGDRRFGGPGSEVFWSATEGELLAAVDPGGTGVYEGVAAGPMSVTVVNRPEIFHARLLGPTVVATQEPFELQLALFDRHGNLVSDRTADVDLRAPAPIAGLPPQVMVDGTGVCWVRGISAAAPGVYRLEARLSDGRTFLSNPVVAKDNPEQRLYWGDPHCHGWGDSTMYLMSGRTAKLDPLQRHLQAREVGRLDFACPGPMSVAAAHRAEVWEAYRDACRRTDQPGAYVPFLAYEGHPPAGDRQTFFRDYADEPLPPPVDTPFETVESGYGDRNDVMLEVHIGGHPPNWELYQPRRERMVEVCSGFGAAEWLLQKALQLGYRPAVCAASDLHLGLLGGPRSLEPFRGRFGFLFPMRVRDSAYGTGPLTATFAPALTREALWDAFTQRQTYGTSGARIYLDVRLGGKRPGSELPAEGPLQLEVTCHGTAPIDRVDLIVGTHTACSWTGASPDVRLSHAIESLPGRYAYLRVHQTDNEYAWSSPFWLLHPGAVPAPSPALLPWNADLPVDLDLVEPGGAERYLPDLLAYIAREEDPERFHRVTPAGLCQQSMGRCALFYCYWGEERLPLSIRWFYEFELPRVRYDWGWRDLGTVDELLLARQLMDKYQMPPSYRP